MCIRDRKKRTRKKSTQRRHKRNRNRREKENFSFPSFLVGSLPHYTEEEHHTTGTQVTMQKLSLLVKVIEDTKEGE